ncbi:hypothetical protein GF326_04605 [Candidatus Bathyarchaeota archaeon]|nr:hypothetical protein [Candidatus Bathyarchaeota archaeon]
MYPALLTVLLVYSLQVSIASSSVVLNYRKNRFLNLALPGYMYVGALAVKAAVKIFHINPYWSLLFCVFLGGLGNVLLNKLHHWSDMKGYPYWVRSLGSIVTYLILHMTGWLVFSYLRSTYTTYWVMCINLKDYDFILFNTPGVIIVSTAWLLFHTLFHHALRPAIRSDKVPRKWSLLVYFLAGASACSSGALYGIWFNVGSTSILLLLLVTASSLFAGFRNSTDCITGSFIVTVSMIWLTNHAQSIIGSWVGEYQLVIPLLFSLVSIPLFPHGVIGSMLSFLSYRD